MNLGSCRRSPARSRYLGGPEELDKKSSVFEELRPSAIQKHLIFRPTLQDPQDIEQKSQRLKIKSNSGTSATGPKWFWDQWRPIANLTWKSEVSRLPRWVSTDASKHYLDVIGCICCAFWCTLSHIICKNKIALRFLWKKLAKISDLENLVDFMSILAQKRVPIVNLTKKSEVSIRFQNFITVW